MPKVSDVFKSTVMRASGLNGSTPIAHILGWRIAVLYGNEAHVLDVEIAGAPRTLKLTSMLSHDIAAVLGDDELDHWPGHAVKLYSFEQKIRDKDTDEDKLVEDVPVRWLHLKMRLSGRAESPPNQTLMILLCTILRRSSSRDDVPTLYTAVAAHSGAARQDAA